MVIDSNVNEPGKHCVERNERKQVISLIRGPRLSLSEMQRWSSDREGGLGDAALWLWCLVCRIESCSAVSCLKTDQVSSHINMLTADGSGRVSLISIFSTRCCTSKRLWEMILKMFILVPENL